jgi:hypothetical protein
MTTEERIAQIIGVQAISICNLQTQLEITQAELAKFKMPPPAPPSGNDPSVVNSKSG